MSTHKQTTSSSATLIVMGLMVLIVIGFLAIAAISTGGGSDNSAEAAKAVTVVNGKQYIDIRAQAGYYPGKLTAKAGMETILRVNTKNTYDCSTALVIPKLNVSKNLPYNGSTEIPLGTPVAGKLQGTCSMGMYNFEISFS